MELIRTNLSRGYQITLPSKARKALGLEANDPLNITFDNKRVVITKGQTIDEQIDQMVKELDELRNEWQERRTPKQKAFEKMSAGWTINQYHEYFDNLPETKAQIKEKYNV